MPFSSAIVCTSVSHCLASFASVSPGCTVYVTTSREPRTSRAPRGTRSSCPIDSRFTFEMPFSSAMVRTSVFHCPASAPSVSPACTT